MPVRLYRDDSYRRTFSATVTGARPAEGGLFAVELDRTLFYPTGGGQPHDTGRLGGLHAVEPAEVVDVREGSEGRILHMVETEVAPEGSVTGEIDWSRRFDHMQQHTGQHILSRAFVETAGAITRSFHLGATSCTIDLDLERPSTDLMVETETRANDVVFANAPVDIEQLPAEEAPTMTMNKEIVRELALEPGDPVRIIRIGDFDATPCGGTHVRRAGEVGCIVIRAWERFKGGTRVTFHCGDRVVRTTRRLGTIVDETVARLSVPPEEVPAALDRLQAQMAGDRRTIKTLTDALTGAEAVALDATARPLGSCRVLVESFTGRPAEEVALLARKYTLSPGRIALLATTDTESGKTSLVFARSEKNTPDDLRMGEILDEVCRAHGGRGGGGPTQARGGGIAAEVAQTALDEAFGRLGDRIGP